MQSPTTSQRTVNSPADTAKTTTGEGQHPSLAEDLKKIIREGVQIFTPAYSTTLTITTNKLNPSAANFVPKSATLDPNSSEFTPNTHANSSSPIFSKHSIPTSTSSPSSSRLNPTSKEFVPNLPVDLPGMLSLPMGNGDPSLLGNGDCFEDESGGYLSVKDIMLSYEKAAPTDTEDKSSELVLRCAAEMLLKVFNYPGSFDEIGKKFQTTLDIETPSDSTLINLAEMLVHWVSSSYQGVVLLGCVSVHYLGSEPARLEICSMQNE